MITIKFADRTRRVDQWVETFEDVVLSYQLVNDRSLTEPVLTLGKEEVTGEKAISRYVDRLKKEARSTWATC